jgi:dGTPase
LRPDYGYSEYDSTRFGTSPSPEDSRSPFARDYDRLIYQSAFRRLQGKTQVVTPGQGDFFRTRLTHTLEVAQVASRLAEQMNSTVLQLQADGKLADWDEDLAELIAPDGLIDPDVCAAAAILHDLGHPPFGHAGERALAATIPTLLADPDCPWDQTDHGSFDGNAQSFRLAVHALPHKRLGGGLELTRAVLDACLKYPRMHGEGVRKWSVFPSEKGVFEDFVRQDVPQEIHEQQTIEAAIMDWADDIAYSVHDIDDWSQAGYMPIVDLVTSPQRIESLSNDILRAWKENGKEHDPDETRAAIQELFRSPEGPFGAVRKVVADGKDDPTSWPVIDAIRQARSALFGEFMASTKLRLRPDSGDAPSKRYRLTLDVDKRSKLRCDVLREMLNVYVISSPQMATHQHGHMRVVEELLWIHARAAWNASDHTLAIFPFEVREELRAGEGHNQRLLRLVVDSVASMTDAYAQLRHARLTGADSRFNEFL